jgi:hypothetical protein
MRKGLDFSRQLVHSRRANFRTSLGYDPESEASQQVSKMKVSRMGFAKCNDFELKSNDKQNLYAGHSVIEPIIEKKIEVTPELKRKCKENEKKAEEQLKNMLEARVKRKRFGISNDLHKIKCKENNYMQKEMAVSNKENSRSNYITFDDDDEEVDISSYKHLLNKDTPKKDIEHTPKFGLGKRLKQANFTQSKHTS